MSTFVVDVWGDLACFSRPETKVERFSYPIITPSAARGVLDAVYAKPQEFGWRVDKIELLAPISYIALKRNEVKERISETRLIKAMKGAEAPLIVSDATADYSGTDQEGRTQRQTMALKNVAYRIHAHIHPRPGIENRLKALIQQARRRIEAGKCFYQPYLGCREFAAYFEPASDRPVYEFTGDVGWMVYDVFNLDEVVIDCGSPYVSVFYARIERGVMEVPPWESDLVKKP
ncbi:MAG: type I-C CRISPR-associated protein Cas5c [Candidatus Desulforudis sp.]|nr:type I-C CRISPR-associated protein Cas5c [Desulforudis sp.]MBV1734196.1 type I-C CRISPR-associated protein Cas5c [Desulforudis sp.]